MNFNVIKHTIFTIIIILGLSFQTTILSAETAQTPENTSELFLQKIADIQQKANANRSNLEAAKG